MRTYKKTPGLRYYRTYTEENVANALAVVNNDMTEKFVAPTFQILHSIHVTKNLEDTQSLWVI